MLPHAPVPQPTVDVHHLPVHAACTEKWGKPNCFRHRRRLGIEPVLNRFGRERLCQCSSPAVVLGLPL